MTKGYNSFQIISPSPAKEIRCWVIYRGPFKTQKEQSKKDIIAFFMNKKDAVLFDSQLDFKTTIVEGLFCYDRLWISNDPDITSHDELLEEVKSFMISESGR